MKKIRIDKKIIIIYFTIIIVALIIRIIMLGISNFEFKYKTLKQIRSALNSLEECGDYSCNVGNVSVVVNNGKIYNRYTNKDTGILYYYIYDGDDTYFYSVDSYNIYNENVIVKLNSRIVEPVTLDLAEYKNFDDKELLKMAFDFSIDISKEVLYDPSYDSSSDILKLRSAYTEYIIVKNKNKEFICFDSKKFLPQYIISSKGINYYFIEKGDERMNEPIEYTFLDYKIIDEVDYEGEIYK